MTLSNEMYVRAVGYRTYELKKLDWPERERRAVMNISSIRQKYQCARHALPRGTTNLPDTMTIEKQDYDWLLNEIDHLTALLQKAIEELSDIDQATRELCRDYTDVVGDSYGVPAVETIVKDTIDHLTIENNQLKRHSSCLLERKEYKQAVVRSVRTKP